MSQISSLSANHTSPHAHEMVTRIEPSRGWVSLRLKELWEYRELLYFLVWRDVKVRYKQTALGALWAFLQPFLTMLMMYLIFGQLAKLGPADIPYSIWNYIGLVPWMFFAGSFATATNSLIGSSNLIRKVYFPRLTIPMASILAGLVDFALAFILVIPMMFYFKILPTVNVIFLPLFLILALITCLGVGLWLSALNIQYRDVRYIVPFLTQFWMFATPVMYDIHKIPEKWRTLYALNPMVGVVEGFRWALLGTKNVNFAMLSVSALVSILILISGMYYFRRTERIFADLV